MYFKVHKIHQNCKLDTSQQNSYSFYGQSKVVASRKILLAVLHQATDPVLSRCFLWGLVPLQAFVLKRKTEISLLAVVIHCQKHKQNFTFLHQVKDMDIGKHTQNYFLLEHVSDISLDVERGDRSASSI